MRIVYVIARMDPGGAERVVLHLAERGRESHEITVVSGGGPWVERLDRLGVDHVTVPGGRPDRAPSTAATASAVRRVVRSFEPDLVHTNNIRITVGAALGVMLSGRRPTLLTTAHGTTPEAMGRAAQVLRRTSPTVVACARALADDLAAGGFPVDRLRVIANGAALEPAGDDRVRAMRSGLGLSSRRPLVVGLGRLVGQKNWGLLIEATRGLEGVDVMVAGDGPLRDSLEDRARAAGGAVRFLGYVEDVPALLASATCVVSTSDSEGLPMALLEAMSLGVPLIATAVDGIPEHLGAGAVLVPPRDSEAVRGELERMVADPEHRDAIAACALEVAASSSPAAMVAAYHELYEELVS